jgi:lysophospholipase L1-like esterase
MRRFLSATAAVTLVVAWSVTVAPTATAVTTYTYVNMGDSLSSGEGTYGTYASGTDTANNKCHRSSLPYSAEYDLISITNYALINVACSGAGTSEIHYRGADHNTGGIPDAGEEAQDLAVTSSTKLVTLTVGINDVGLLGFATECYMKNNLAQEDECFRGIPTRADYLYNLNGLTTKLYDAYNHIRGRSANAVVAVLTYPQIFPSTYTGDCQTIPFTDFHLVSSQGMLNAARTVVQQLNAKIANEVARHPGFILVDIENALAGHDVCSGSQWVNQINGFNYLNQTTDPESLHPNHAGYQAIARVVAKRLDAGYFADGTVNQSIVNAYNAYGGPGGIGYPANNGGGTFVHYWDGPQANVQDFTNGSFGPTIIVQGPNGSFVVNYGFRDAYINGGWSRTCLAPLTNAYAYGAGTRQDFVNCYMTWSSSTGVVVHGPNPNTCTNYGGTTMTGSNACVGFYTTSVWFSGGGIGLYGKEIWTYANGTVRDSTANYTLHGLDPTRAYTLQAYIPNGHSNASYAHYHYCGTNGGCAEGYVNQNNFTNAWANFGTVCTSDGNATIMLADDGGDRYPIQVGADAIRGVRTGIIC